MSLEVGQNAPIFPLLNDEGEEVSLSDFKGKDVVLYFYPKDNTPGCTIEAQDFSNKSEDFEELDCVIIGVSKDSVKSHCNFIEKYDLAFNLLSDSEGVLCEAYGVTKEKSMFGKKYLGIDRSTFLIDKKGKIAKIWRSVKVKGHVDEVFSEVLKLHQ